MREADLDVKSARMHVIILKKKKALCIPAYCMFHLLRGPEAVCVGQARMLGSAGVSSRQCAEEGRLRVWLPGEHLWLRRLLLI